MTKQREIRSGLDNDRKEHHTKPFFFVFSSRVISFSNIIMSTRKNDWIKRKRVEKVNDSLQGEGSRK